MSESIKKVYKGFPFISEVDGFVASALLNRMSEYTRAVTPWIKATPGAYHIQGAKKITLESIRNDNINEDWKNTNNYKFYQLYRPDMSFRPISGITGITVDFKNKFGGVRKATISWMAHTINELEELAPYFMNPGKSILLEWGWNTGGKYKYDFANMIDRDVNLSNYFKKTLNKITDSNGNYDSMIGIIINYNCSMNDDLSYTVTTDIVSTAALMEGISMTNQKFIAVANNKPKGDLIQTNQNQTDKSKSSEGDDEDGNGMDDLMEHTILTYIRGDDQQKSLEKDIFKIVAGSKYWNGDDNQNKKDVAIYVDGNGGQQNAEHTYVTWGYIEDNVLTKFGHKLFIQAANTEILKFDSSGIPIRCHTYLRTTDLDVCVLPTWTDHDVQASTTFGIDLYNDYSRQYFSTGNTSDGSTNNDNFKNTGFVRNIFINLKYFKDKMTSVDNLYDAILSLFQGISGACGNLWDFKITAAPDSSRVFICDASYMDDIKGMEIFQFNTRSTDIVQTGLFPSVMKSFNIETSLSNDVAMNVFYASQKHKKDKKILNGPNDSVSNTFYFDYEDSFTNYVRDAEDNSDTKMSESDGTEAPTDDEQSKDSNVMKQYNDTKYSDELKSYLPVYSGQTVKYELGMKYLITSKANKDEKSTICNAIVPVHVTINVEGISGFKIGDIFMTDCVPNIYKAKGIFQIIGIKHTVNRDSWLTELKALYRVMDSPQGVITPSVMRISGTSNQGQITKPYRGGPWKLSNDIKKLVDEETDAFNKKNNTNFNPKEVRTMCWIESRGNPNAKSPKSTASGLFQFTDSTWKQYSSIHGGSSKSNAKLNTRCGIQYMYDNKKALQKLGMPYDGAHIYLAHQQGVAGAHFFYTWKEGQSIPSEFKTAMMNNGNFTHPKKFYTYWINKYNTLYGLEETV
jgi:predicted  nucleic acid-binding Zn-ribbon protein